MHPIRDRNGSNVTRFSAQVYYCPMPFPLLKMAYSQPGEFVAAESASKKYAEQRPIPFALDPLSVGCLSERVALVGA